MEVTNNLKEWARHEIELAEMGGGDIPLKDEIDRHYEAAYQSFCDFVDRTEGFDKPGLIKTILIQLLHGNPLTGIEDNEEDWELFDTGGSFNSAINGARPRCSTYRCKRRSSLFKEITYNRETGEVDKVKFTDIDRCVCVDIASGNQYQGRIGRVVLDEMVPITMPYSPVGTIKIYTEDFKSYEDCDGDFDTVGIFYFRMDDGRMVDVRRFFKEDRNTHQMVEINKTEYFARRKKRDDRERKWKKDHWLEEGSK